MEHILLAIWMLLLTMGLAYMMMSESDERKRIENSVETKRRNGMTMMNSYKEESAIAAPLGKVERWFVGLTPEEQDFIAEKAVNEPEGKWRAPMWRAAQKNGLDAGITSFRDFIAKLSDNPGYLIKYNQ